jgi:hypothetical protein
MNYKDMWEHCKTLLSEQKQDYALGIMHGIEIAENTIDVTNPDPKKPVAQTRKMSYDHVNDVVYIDAHESEFHADYLKYLIEYLDIPKSARKVFTRDSIKS